jgi:hypothetical protein
MHDAAPPTTTITTEDTEKRSRRSKVPTIHSAQSLDEADTSRYIGYSRSWLRQQRMRAKGPVFFRVGRTIRYRIADLESWLDRHRVRTSDVA